MRLLLFLAMIMQIQARPIPWIYQRASTGTPVIPSQYFAEYTSSAVVLPPPIVTGGFIVPAAGSYSAGVQINYRIYSYRTVNGVRTYSTTYYAASLTTEPLSTGLGIILVRNVGDDPLPPTSFIEGFRLLQQSAEPGHETNFDVFRDVPANYDPVTHYYSSDYFVDGSWTEWTAGSTVTPAQAITLLDVSGNGRHAPWNGVGTTPTLEAAAWYNGTPAVRFTGRPCITAAFAAQSVMSAVFALRINSIAQFGGRRFAECGTDPTGTMSVYPRQPAIGTYRWAARQDFTGALLASTSLSNHTNPTVVGVVWGGGLSTSLLGVNGEIEASGSIGSNTGTKIAIGGGVAGAVGPDMDFRAARFWNRALSSAELVTEMQNFSNQHITPFTFQRKLESGDDRLLETGDLRLIQ